MKESKQAVGYIVLVFLLGMALGGGGMYWATSNEIVLAKKERLHKSRTTPKDWVGWLSKELALDEEQAEQLGTILDETSTKYSAIREKTHPRYEEARQAGRDNIRAILNEEQRAKFEELVRRIDEKEKARHWEAQERRRTRTSKGEQDQ